MGLVKDPSASRHKKKLSRAKFSNLSKRKFESVLAEFRTFVQTNFEADELNGLEHQLSESGLEKSIIQMVVHGGGQ